MGIKIHIAKDCNGKTSYLFFCPACNIHHGCNDTWNFNGDLENPTFSPSLLVFGGKPDLRCHSFIKNGEIQYLSDCHHNLAGKTIKIPDFEFSLGE